MAIDFKRYRRSVHSQRPGQRKRAPILFAVSIIAVTATLLLLVAREPQGHSFEMTTDVTATQNAIEITEKTDFVLFPVHIDGAVKSPGVYSFKEGAILAEAIQEAGGLTAVADTSQVNLAMLLSPHIKVYIPEKGEEMPFLPGSFTEHPADGKIDINRASQAELETLPGIGQAMASAIISYREQHGAFNDTEDLMRVPGIKEGRFSQIESLITVGAP
jgi:competence protein ComEA